MVQRQLMLTDEANQFIQQQLASGRFASPDEVVSNALEAAGQFASEKRLAELIREGLDSGSGEEFTEESFDKMMDEARDEFERRQSA